MTHELLFEKRDDIESVHCEFCNTAENVILNEAIEALDEDPADYEKGPVVMDGEGIIHCPKCPEEHSVLIKIDIAD